MFEIHIMCSVKTAMISERYENSAQYTLSRDYKVRVLYSSNSYSLYHSQLLIVGYFDTLLYTVNSRIEFVGWVVIRPPTVQLGMANKLLDFISGSRI